MAMHLIDKENIKRPLEIIGMSYGTDLQPILIENRPNEMDKCMFSVEIITRVVYFTNSGVKVKA